MTIDQWVWISYGQFSLMATFAIGILIGISLKRKDSQHDDSNSDKDEAAEKWRQWHNVERR